MSFLAEWPFGLRALLVVLVSSGVTALVTPLVRQFAVRRGLVARPIEDRWKRRVVGKLGGIAIYAGLLSGSVLGAFGSHALLPFLLGTSLLFLTGLVDDVRQIRPSTKLIAQTVTTCLLFLLGLRMELLPQLWLAIPLALFWMLLITNAVNLLDNMDGAAAGVVAIASLFLALHGYLRGDQATALLAAAIGGAAAGFLWFNAPPAKIFMGDCGSQMLGMALGMTTLLGTWQHGTQLLATLALPTFILSVPIFDTLFVTWTRFVQGRKVFAGGTDHVSHRLAILGLSERQVLGILYGLSGGFGVLGLLSLRMPFSLVLVVLLTAFALCLVIGAYLAKGQRVYQLQWVAPEVSAQPRQTILHTMLFHKRQTFEVVVDILLISAAYVGAHVLRFEGRLDGDIAQLVFRSLPIVIALKLTIFFTVGLYRGIWRYISIVDLGTLARAIVLGSLCSVAALLYLWRFEGYSRAAFIIDGILLFLGMGAVRVAERWLNEWLQRLRTARLRAIIVGAGDAGELLLRDLRNNHASPYHVIGFVDDDLAKRGRRIHGVPVLGPRTALTTICQQQRVEEILVALPSMPLSELRDVIQPWIGHGLHVRMMNTLLREASEMLTE